MITWMQKHKKWLVITIWISTIAFVGAGFVGWGSYDYNKPSGSVATVGNKDIEIKDLQQEYSNLYNQYQQMFGDQFNQELAQKLNLEDIAYNNLIQRFLLLNLAEDFGIIATKTEIATELVKIPSFVKDNKFDKKLYLKILKQNRTNPTSFEAQIKQDLTVRKLTKVFSTTANIESIKNINQLFFAKDKVSIKIINLKDIKVTSNNKDLKAYWDTNKENYKSNQKYKINIEKIALQEDTKKSKKEALKKYLSIKKSASKFNQTQLLDETTASISKEDLDKIFTSKVGTLLKPIKTKDNYIVVQLIEIIKPQVLSFNDVKDKVKSDYIAKIKQDALVAKRNKLLKNFTGLDLGYIAKDVPFKIKGLTEEEVTNLLKHIFNSTSIINSIDMDNKTVVYKIFDTKLASYDKDKDQFLEQSISKIKDQEILSVILKELKNKYTITSYMQAK